MANRQSACRAPKAAPQFGVGRRGFRITRRAFTLGLSGLLGAGGLLVTAPAMATDIAESDPRLEIETVSYSAELGDISAYLAKPAGATDLPTVILLHDSTGLDDHFKNMARRMALEGFLVIAPDVLSPFGGTPDDEDWARQMIRELDRQQALANFRAALPFAARREDSNGKVGCVGFAWGGGMAARMAVNDPDLAAAAVYYGSPPPAEAVANIKGRLLLHYAGADANTNARIPGFLGAMTIAGTDFQLYVYDDMERSFANDSVASRYDEQAANLAWQRTIDFLKETLL
ncbi:MAG: dienelactone hydrolase family protein [Pseudomonadota bacterium]